MIDNVLWVLALVAALSTGVSLPSVIASDYAIVPAYEADNTLHVAVLPKPKLRPGPERVDQDPGPQLSAKAAYVMDKTSGAVLWEKNAEAQLPIASITKLMTAVVAQNYITNWDQPYTLQWGEVSLGGSTFAGYVGDTFSAEDLLKTALVASANSAAAGLAHSTGLPEDQFVAAMNSKTQLLGMAQTHYVEPTGLNAGNVSSARDLATLMRTITAYHRLMEPMQQSEHRMVKRDPSGQPLPDNQEVIVHTTDRLLKEGDPFIVAGKTGFTDEAGNCLVSLERNDAGHEIIIALLGAPDETSRFTETHDLAAWAFDHYRWP